MPSSSPAVSAASTLDSVFDADRRLRQAEAALLAAPTSELVALLTDSIPQARTIADRQEATARLLRLADLCAQVPGPAMADALLRLLDDEEPAVRVAAGEAILDVAYERYAEIAHAIERCLERRDAGPAMSELPWILAEVAEGSALTLLSRFLRHDDADVVAATLEALVQLGDPDAIEAISKLRGDKRRTTMEDLDEEAIFTIGELADDALKELQGVRE